MNEPSTAQAYGLYKKAGETIIAAFKELGYDTSGDPNFADTPDRFARAWSEMFPSKESIEASVEDICSVTFPATYDEMVTTTGIKTFSICPHHLLPVEYDISIGYVPQESVLGLSKVARIAHLLSARAVLQEQLTDDIASMLEKYLKPQGVGVIVRGAHLCMRMRGIQEPNAFVTTSSLKGVFMSRPEARDEFLRFVGV